MLLINGILISYSYTGYLTITIPAVPLPPDDGLLLPPPPPDPVFEPTAGLPLPPVAAA
jgi:hypothetical protein